MLACMLNLQLSLPVGTLLIMSNAQLFRFNRPTRPISRVKNNRDLAIYLLNVLAEDAETNDINNL